MPMTKQPETLSGEELLPCPFCRNTELQKGYEAGSMLHYVRCVNGEKNKRHVVMAAYGWTIEEAIISWNTRTPLPTEDKAQSAGVEKLVKAVEMTIYDCCHSLSQPSMQNKMWGDVKDYLTKHIVHTIKKAISQLPANGDNLSPVEQDIANETPIMVPDSEDDDPIKDAYAKGYGDGYKARALVAEADETPLQGL